MSEVLRQPGISQDPMHQSEISNHCGAYFILKTTCRYAKIDYEICCQIGVSFSTLEIMKSAETDQYHWFCIFQVDLYGASNVVSGIITQGTKLDDNENWVESFMVRTGLQQCDMQYVLGNNNEPLVS